MMRLTMFEIISALITAEMAIHEKDTARIESQFQFMKIINRDPRDRVPITTANCAFVEARRFTYFLQYSARSQITLQPQRAVVTALAAFVQGRTKNEAPGVKVGTRGCVRKGTRLLSARWSTSNVPG